MAKFGKTSLQRQEGLCIELKEASNQVIQVIDHSIICSIRSKEDQNKAFNSSPQRSHIKWPMSKHNVTSERTKADAIDVWPWIPGFGAISGSKEQIADIMLKQNKSRVQVLAFVYKSFARLSGYYQMAGYDLGFDTIWGGDWDNDGNLLDQNFHDLPHIEIVR